MKNIVIYGSQYGNTKKIAEKIALGAKAEIINAAQIKNINWEDIMLLVVGSPTQGGRPTKVIYDILNPLMSNSLNNIKIAAFDTRFNEKKINFFLKLLIKAIDYAAPKINKILISKGGKSIIEPEGFIVLGKEGPLENNEEGRAYAWGQKLITK